MGTAMAVNIAATVAGLVAMVAAPRRRAMPAAAATALEMALLLAQGSGRLIRTTEDKGVVAVLDPRVVTARYGGYLLASLPPMWRTTERSVVLKALGRLGA